MVKFGCKIWKIYPCEVCKFSILLYYARKRVIRFRNVITLFRAYYNKLRRDIFSTFYNILQPNFTTLQGPRSNFWIEGAKCLASQRRFSTFFRFSSTILRLRRVHVYCWAFFRSLLVNIGKNICMLFRPNPFAFFLLDVRVRFPKITGKMLMRCS